MSRSLRICFIGDSIVNGTGDPDCLGWPGRVCADARAKGHDVTAYNLGVRRETSRDVRHRWRTEVDRRLPRGVDGALIFSFGVNDTMLEDGAVRVSPDHTIENAVAILDEARSRWPVLFVGPSPVSDATHNQRILALSEQLLESAQAAGVPYLSVAAELLRTPAWINEVRNNDGAHPGRGGYAALAMLVQNWSAWRAWFE